MKKLTLIPIMCILMTACQDTLPVHENIDTTTTSTKQPGMQRVVAASSTEIESLIACMGDEYNPASRTLLSPSLSNSEDEFVSLIDADRIKVMSTLTPEQLDSIYNDEDELEYYPNDSVIADFRFAQLLNANREIEVDNIVYRYYPNGVAFAPSIYVEDLQNIDSLVAQVEVTEETLGSTVSLNKTTNFTILNYRLFDPNEEIIPIDGGSGVGNGGNNGGNDEDTPNDLGPVVLTLENGVEIHQSQIRELNYNDRGDANWITRIWNSRWGTNTVARKKFSSRRQLNMNFYDQNYIVYANIGTKLKMQKKVCGIWWNIKAQEMVQGWETITIEYSHEDKPINQFVNPYNNQNEYPTFSWSPTHNNEILLLYLPYENYDFNSKNISGAYKTALEIAWNLATSEIKELINNDKKRAGLMLFNEYKSYFNYGPQSIQKSNVRSMEHKFYARWFPGTYNFGFSNGSGFKITGFTISGNDGIKLHRGAVYGAIKYKGQWLAARITKDSD